MEKKNNEVQLPQSIAQHQCFCSSWERTIIVFLSALIQQGGEKLNNMHKLMSYYHLTMPPPHLTARVIHGWLIIINNVARLAKNVHVNSVIIIQSNKIIF